MKRTILKATSNFSKRDEINCVNGLALQENCGEEIEITAAALCETVDDDGELKEVSILVDSARTYYTSISESVFNSTEVLIDLINEEGQVNVRVDKRTSKSGRPYLVMTIL